MTKRERIGFIRHAHALQTPLAGIFKRIANNPLHAFARIKIFLRRDLVRGSLLEESTHPHVKPLGVLAEDDEIHILLAAVLQRRESLIKQYARPRVDV